MLDAIVSKFSGRIKKGKGYNVICPTHSDKQPSLSINPGKDGRVVMHCQAGCSTKDILAAVALTERDLFPAHMQAARGSARDHPIAENGGARSRLTSYDYPDEAGTLLYQTVRKEPKGFFQRRPDGKGGWITNLNGTRRVLYRLPDLVNADKARTVLIVEGEKDADALAAIGELATCNPQGAGKWRDEYSETLKGRRCVILPDNDEPGERHAIAVGDNLAKHGIDAYILRLPGLPEKGDVSDWLAQGNTTEDLYALVTGADNIPIITAIDGAADTAENGDDRSAPTGDRRRSDRQEPGRNAN